MTQEKERKKMAPVDRSYAVKSEKKKSEIFTPA